MRLKTKHIAVISAIGLLSTFLLGTIAYSKHQMQPNRKMVDAENLNDRVEQLAQAYIAEREQVALVIGVIQNDKTHIQGFGKFSDTDPVPPSADTIYEIGSITKLFTGIALTKLALDGRVSLDAPITDYLPGDVIVAPAAQNITLRQLATHTSGLPRLPANLDSYSINDANPYVNYTAEALYEELAQVQLLNQPGTQYEYSNLGVGLLGHLLALKTGQSYEELIQTIVTEPLGMSDTTITLSAEQQQRWTPGHTPDGRIVSNWDFDVLAGAGAFRSTANDMLKLIQAGLTQTNAPLSIAIGQSQQVQFAHPEGEVGLAWQILGTEDVTFYWHNGGTGGYASFLALDQANQTGIILLSNYGDAFSTDQAAVALMLMAGEILHSAIILPLQ